MTEPPQTGQESPTDEQKRAARSRALALNAAAAGGTPLDLQVLATALPKSVPFQKQRAYQAARMKKETKQERKARLIKYKERVKPFPEVAPQEELLTACRQIGDLTLPNRDRALFATLYLTGGRVSEVLALAKRDIRQNEAGDWLFNLITEKQSGTPYREVGVPLLTETELAFAKELSLWLELKKPDDLLFSLTRWNVVQRFKKAVIRVRFSYPKDVAAVMTAEERNEMREFTIHPHYLRHCRLTHLVQYGLTDSDLRQVTGWRTNVLASTYVSLKAADIIRKLKGKLKAKQV